MGQPNPPRQDNLRLLLHKEGDEGVGGPSVERSYNQMIRPPGDGMWAKKEGDTPRLMKACGVAP